MFQYLQALSFCLREGFPPAVTAALLRYGDGDLTAAEAQAIWAEAENDDRLAYEWTGRFAEAAAEVSGSDEPVCCAHCDDWVDSDDSTSIHNGDRVCDYCIPRHYTECNSCDEYHRDHRVYHVEGNPYCEDCRNDLPYCDECDEYFVNNDHEHEAEDCDCEAPRQQFRFPANGHGTVANDERLDVTLPAGIIDDLGMQAIHNLLWDNLHADLDRVAIRAALAAVGDSWHGEKGNFTRRLSREMHKTYKVKIPPGVLTEVGNLAKQHSDVTSEWSVAFTRRLNMSAEDFAHGESCWWTCYHESRCALKNWGGIGMRTFDQYGNVTGRAWVQPLGADLAPTHDAIGAHAYMVYNCYGDLDGAKAARIVAHLTSKTYGKTSYDADVQYVNGNAGWLVAEAATAEPKPNVYISLDAHDQTDASRVTNSNREIAA